MAAIIAIVAFLVSRQTAQRGAVEFFAAADESSDLHAQASSELESALASIGIIDRPELTRRLDSVSATATEADALLDVEIQSGIAESYGTMTTASTSWKDGADAVNITITAIMDGDLVQGAQEQLEAALDMLRVGDTAYGLFLDSLTARPEDVDVPSFSPVFYINSEALESDPLRYDAQTLVLEIQASYDLSPHHDVSVLGSTVPEPVGESDGAPVVPFAEALDVQAVISNLGNEDEPVVDVVLEMFNVDSGSTTTATERITDLVAGSSTTVVFSDVDVVPGSLYQAKVIATIADDIYLDNNVWEMVFLWRAES
ncbi:MAG: hypothetical protein ABFR95_04380 [Actinomycetota bacterium]